MMRNHTGRPPKAGHKPRRAERPTPPPKPTYDLTLFNKVRNFLQSSSIILASHDELQELQHDLQNMGFFSATPLWYKGFYSRCSEARLRHVDSESKAKYNVLERAKIYHKRLLGRHPRREFLLGYSAFKPDDLKDPENAFLMDLCWFLLGTNEGGSPEKIIEKLEAGIEQPGYQDMLRTEPHKWKEIEEMHNLAAELGEKFPFGPEDLKFRGKIEHHITNIREILVSYHKANSQQ